HPDVYDCVVVGVPDERWGSRVAAVIQPREGAKPTLDAIQEHTRQHIAGYKVPREIHLVDRIERSPSGKPDYPWATRVALGEITAPTWARRPLGGRWPDPPRPPPLPRGIPPGSAPARRPGRACRGDARRRHDVQHRRRRRARADARGRRSRGR